MNQHKTSAELKAFAKGTLLGKYGTAIGALILIQLITQSISFIASLVIDTTNIWGNLINLAITLIMTLIAAIFTVGQISLYLKMAGNQTYKVSDIFNGFKTHPDKAIIVQFLLFLISLACILPACLMFAAYYITQASILYIAISLLAVVGVIVSITLALSYSQVFYLMLDFPDYTATQLMSLSRTIMKGNRGRLFYLYISFIPLYLLACLSLGIGFLWILPYQQMTTTYFYLDLIRCREQNIQNDSIDTTI